MTNSIGLPLATLQRLRAQATTEKRRRAIERTLSQRDFVGFCEHLDIIPKGGRRTKLRLNPIQRKYCARRTPRDNVLKARQIGLTTLELARDVYTFLTWPGARVVVTCQSLTDHGPLNQLSTAIQTMFSGLRRDGLRLPFTTESRASWVLKDRDASLRIIEAGASEAAAEKKGRSGTITRLHLTETAYYEYADQTLNALLECVPGPEFGTEIVTESTANGAGGRFYEQHKAASEGHSGYTAHFFPWFEQTEYRAELEPGEIIEPETTREHELVRRFEISPEQLKWYRLKVQDKGQDLVDQEYPSDPETCWITTGRTFFSQERTQLLLSKSTDPVIVEEISTNGGAGKLALWADVIPFTSYVIVVDPSEGVGGDPGAAVLYQRDTGEHVGTLHGQFTTRVMADLVDKLGRRFNLAIVVVERNNHGHAVLLALDTIHKYPHIWSDADERIGWKNSTVSRSSALESLEGAHRKGEWTTPDRDTLAEFNTFIVLHGKAQAAPGAHDDRVIAHAIAHDILTKVSTLEYDASYDDDLPQLRI
jgi:hypothetical protein